MKPANGSRNLTERTTNILWASSGGRCQFRGCNVGLIGDLISGKRDAKVGANAHIIADGINGPRGDRDLSPKYANDPANLMLLCSKHHVIIDRDEETYTVKALRDMKREHEEWVARVLSLGPSSQTEVLRFGATVGLNEVAVPMDACAGAMAALGLTPASWEGTHLSVRGARFADDEHDYWAVELRALRRGFAEKLQGRIQDGDVRRLAIFAWGPIPLLIELGRLVSDFREAFVFQRHREPEPSWTWAEDMPPMGLRLHPGAPGPRRVSLKVSVSAPIDDARITSVLGLDVSIW